MLDTAILSRAAYGRDGYIIDEKYLIQSEKTDTQCYVIPSDNNSVYIVFRGTEKKMRDIITDLMAFHKKIPYDIKSKIRVHSGFLKAYESVREAILDRLIELKPDSVVVAGHSLGGALSTLCAVDIQKNHITENILLETYGSPKVGNRHFKKSTNKRVPNHNRYTNRFDIVPTVPVFARHCGKKIKLKPKIRHDINNYIYNIENS